MFPFRNRVRAQASGLECRSSGVEVSNPAHDRARHKLLLVDPASGPLAALARSLGGQFDVSTAESAEAALAILEQHGPFAVVVSDHELPAMKGTEFLAQVHQRWPETVGIMLAGAIDVDVAIRALNSGRIRGFLEKPCPEVQLLAALEDGVIERRVSQTAIDQCAFGQRRP